MKSCRFTQIKPKYLCCHGTEKIQHMMQKEKKKKSIGICFISLKLQRHLPFWPKSIKNYLRSFSMERSKLMSSLDSTPTACGLRQGHKENFFEGKREKMSKTSDLYIHIYVI